MKPFWKIKKRYLLLIAGCVWLLAGVNVALLGIKSYVRLDLIRAYYFVLSIAVFVVFGAMFFRMSIKHTKRIESYPEEYRPFWHFFDLKSYIIMAVMMSGGIWLRSSGTAPDVFIAVFYTGLGFALALAGALFLYRFILGVRRV